MTPPTAHGRPSSVRGALLALSVVLGVLLGTATAAQAHTELVSSDPAGGGTVTAPLDAVELTFSGPVLVREVAVLGPVGPGSTTGSASVTGAVVTQPVELADAGLYTVTYQVTSSDGHLVEGTLNFTYAPPPQPSPTTEATTAPAGTSVSEATAAPSEAAADSPAQSSTGLSGSALAAGAAVVVALAAVLVLRRRARR